MSDRMPRLLEGVELPPGLHDLPNPPERAFLWGAVPPRPRVAIVGSRGASRVGLEVARLAAERLARAGLSVISGGAVGIDTAAHRGALDAGRRTLVVAPACLECAYPKENMGLFEEILEAGGGYLSVARRSEPAFGPAFLTRNAALVALADVVVLGEAKLDSGAMNALAAARRLGRHSFVLPTALDVETSRGSELALVRFGARPYFRVEQVLDVLAEQALESAEALDTLRELQVAREARRAAGKMRSRKRREHERTPADTSMKRPRKQLGLFRGPSSSDPESPPRADDLLVGALTAGARTVEALREATMLPLPELQHRLLLLILEGQVIEDEQGLLCYVPRTSDE